MRHIHSGVLILGFMLAGTLAHAQAPGAARQAPQRGAAPTPAPQGNAPAQRGTVALPPGGVAPQTAATGAKKSLTMEDLKKVLALPDDATAAAVLQGATFAEELEEPWITQMETTIPYSTKPATYKALLAMVPVGPTLDSAERDAPGLVDKLRTLAASKDLEGILAISHPSIVTEMATLLEIFDASRYRKHTFGKIIELPGTRMVGVPIYVLPSDAVEKFYFAVFSNIKGNLALRDIQGGPQVAELRLFYEKDLAVQKVKDLFRDLNQNSEATAKAISTTKLYEDLAPIGGWKRLTRGQRLDPDQIKIKASVPLDGKSVRVVTRVTYPTPDRPMAFDVDFERFGNELFAVRLRDASGKDIAVDKNMDCEVLKRYQVTGSCEYKTNYTDELAYLSIDKLKDYAQKAMEDMRVADLSSYAKELETSFPIDATKGLPLGLRATVEFMNRDYGKAYEIGSQAVKAGGEVYFPLLHRVSSDLLRLNPTQPLQKMILGISKEGLHYYPSHESDGKRIEIVVPVAAIKKDGGFQIDKGSRLTKADPFLVIKFSTPGDKPGKTDEQTWNLMALGSVCAAPGTRLSAGQIVWSQSEPCPAPSAATTGPSSPRIPTVPQFPGISTAKAVVILPADWEKTLEAVVRIYEVSKTGSAADAPVKKEIR